MRAEAAYDELLGRLREDALLSSCAEVLAWDAETYLPPAGVAHRAEQLAYLAGLQHARATDPRLGELLAELESSPLVRDPESDAAVNVRVRRRAYDRLIRLPRALVEELTRTVSFAQQEWLQARAASEYERFRPWLERVVDLKCRQAACLGAGDAYDTMLDEYEPGARADDLCRLFDVLRQELVPLAWELTHAPRQPRTAVLRRAYPVEAQRAFSERAAALLGFDFRRGRIDTTAHPFFSHIGPDDFRISTRFPARGFDGFFSTLHELGHALYDQGLNPGHYGTPLGEGASLGVHESQARLWENAVGRGLAFWEFFFPLARAAFPAALRGVPLAEFHFAVNNVEPTPTRVEADEVTYNLHILVRFELERALVAGVLRAADVPAAWNEAYRHHLGVTPHSDVEGCLQDSHWADGLIGYFPTYAVGNLLAAQLFARARQDLGDLDAAFARGDFGGLRGWLQEHVYRHGRRYRPAELIARATGAPPDHRPLLDELRQKYGALYRI
jgi:carboxypeptidase Taq